MSEIRDYYETYWSGDGFNPRFDAATPVLELFDREIRRAARCLDVGCGDGRTAGTWLNANGRDYVGVDISSNAVAQARSLGLEAQRIEDLAALPFEESSFDAATCLEVFEHLFQPQLAAREILRLLRPGGVLVATVPNAVYWRRRVDFALVGRVHPYGDELSGTEPWRDPHIRFFTRRSLTDMLTSVGFVDVVVNGHGGGVLKDLPWIGMRAWRGRYSSVYRRAERALPALLGLRLNVVARKPL